MNKYELVFESLQKSLNNGEITLEEAEVLNEYAYDKYVEEATRLSKEIHKINNIASSNNTKDISDAKNMYINLLKNAGVKPDRINSPVASAGYGGHGYTSADSLRDGKKYSKDMKDGNDNTHMYSGKARKNIQKRVFNTKPSDSSYYDAKKSVTDDAKQRVHDDNLTYGKRRMQYLNSRHKEELAKTKNPLKKAKYKIDNKYDKESIAKDYIKREKEIDKGNFRLNYDDRKKLKEILKHRK